MHLKAQNDILRGYSTPWSIVRENGSAPTEPFECWTSDLLNNSFYWISIISVTIISYVLIIELLYCDTELRYA